MASGSLFYFNPTCEMAVANGSFSYQPPLLLKEMERELAILPFVFCSPDDFVLTETRPSENFLQVLKNSGFKLPRFCNFKELEAMPDDTFDKIIPWGWSPATHFYLKKLKEKCSAEFKTSPVFHWNDQHKMLYERSTSKEFLTDILSRLKYNWLISDELTGHIILNFDELESLLKEHGQLVVKAPLSSSGRGIQMIRNPELDNARKQWISGILKQQKYLIAEPLLDKIIDFSFQFKILAENRIEYLGLSFFETNSNGQYLKTLINADVSQIQDKTISENLKSVADTILSVLSSSVYSKLYQGYLGVDAMIFRYENKLMLHPCVEVNCRANMGILSKFIENNVHVESRGMFELFYGAPGQFISKMSEQTKLNPIVLADGKIISGVIPLTEGNQKTKFGAYFSVEESK